jgi:hypothetical protein
MAWISGRGREPIGSGYYPSMLRAICAAVTLAACALSLGCGQTCKCNGDVCLDCSGTSTPAASGVDAGNPASGDAAVESAALDGAGDDGNTTTDGSTPLCRDDQSCPTGGSDGGDFLDGGVAPDDTGSGHDAGAANDGVAACISGCARGQITCSTPDPPVGWRCSGPGINSAARFVDAGCTSVPINSVAWCCPDTFLSRCVCTPGQDWTCNDDPAISSIHGTCLPDSTCSCSMGSGLNPASGKCR